MVEAGLAEFSTRKWGCGDEDGGGREKRGESSVSESGRERVERVGEGGRGAGGKGSKVSCCVEEWEVGLGLLLGREGGCVEE